MNIRLRYALLSLIALALVVTTGLTLQARTAMAANTSCVTNKSIQNWNSASQISDQGFNEVTATSGSVTYKQEPGKYLSLDLAVSETNAPSVARVTEGDASLPVNQRVKCWQPTATKSVVATFDARFDAPTSPFLTETLFLWNMPFSADGNIPLTAVGVTRGATTGGHYAAIVAQDLVFNPDFSFSGYLNIVPVPQWLDPTQWHSVRITLTQTTATVEVAQGIHPFTPVIVAPLAHAPEPLAVEFSLDNELVPGLHIPVYAPDGVDIDTLDISLR